MTQKNQLYRGITDVFLSQEEAKEIVQDEETMMDLCKLAQKETLTEFSNYLGKDCDLSLLIIYDIVRRLLKQQEIKQALGGKLIILYLKYILYDVMDILKPKFSAERSAISEVIDGFPFVGSSLEELIKMCGKKINIPYDDKEEIDGIKEEIISKQKGISDLFTEAVVYEDKNIEEKITDFIEDYNFFPQHSIEKKLQKQLIVAFINSHPQAKQFANKIAPELQIENHQFDQLYKAYQENNYLNKEISSMFKKMNRKEYSKIYQTLYSMKSLLSGINILELERLIQKTKESEKMVKDKDVVFMMGTTGSGKSTNILKCLGYKLKWGTYKNLQTLVPAGPLQKDHQKFMTSPETKSCTRYIYAVPVPDMYYAIGTKSDNKKLVICDSPGFGESAGVEVDIANGVGMINALYGCRSLRVVIIISYNALMGNKLDGAIDIGRIISDIFYDISKISDKIVILFNKVPVQKYSQVPKLTTNKMEHLSEEEKADQKLVAFFQILLQQSEKRQNFIDPLESDYKRIFQNIIDMRPINDVKKNLRYDFAEDTKRKLVLTTTNLKIKVKEYFERQEYEIACFHLTMLQKLRNILDMNVKINEAFQESCNFIKQVSRRQCAKFEELLLGIFNGEETNKTFTNLKLSKEKLLTISKYFHQFDEIDTINEEKINEIITKYKNKLFEQSRDLTNVNSQRTFNVIKSFSRELAPTLEKQVLAMLHRQIAIHFQNVNDLLLSHNYAEMKDPMKNLKSIIGFIKHLSENHLSLKNFEVLKQNVHNLVRKGFDLIDQNIHQNKTLTEKSIGIAKRELSYIEQIQALHIIDQEADILKNLNECIKKMISKCRGYIKELQNFDLSISSTNETTDSNQNYKVISKKKIEIQLLMTINKVSDELMDDYSQTKDSMGRKLKENQEFLEKCIKALKNNKIDEIERDIDLIRGASEIVLKLSQLFDQKESCREITEAVMTQFIKYLAGERRSINKIQVKLNSISQKNIQQIDNSYKKLDQFSKMAGIHQKIGNSVQQLKRQFKKKLKQPFQEFKDKDIPQLLKYDHYKKLIILLDRFGRLCYYSLEVESIESKEQYNEISLDEGQIQTSLKRYLLMMRNQVTDFISGEPTLLEIPNLKELIQILIAMNAKTHACIYLSRKLDFDVQELLSSICHKLLDIKDLIQFRFVRYYDEENKINQLTTLKNICSYYCTIDNYFKGKNQMQINFSQLCQKIKDCLNKSFIEDEERAKSLISDYMPTKIRWGEVKQIYDQFYNVNTQDSKRKRGIITNSLQTVQMYIQRKLNEFKSQIAFNSDMIIKDKLKMNQFLELFKEAIEIEKRLDQIYRDVDRHLIRINSRLLREVGTHMIEAYMCQFDSVKFMLTDYNITNISEKISNFGTLENIIYNVFLNNDEKKEQNQKSEQNKIHIQRLINFIQTSKTSLIQQITPQPGFEQRGYQHRNSNRLYPPLQFLYSSISNQIEQKYNQYNETSFTIDDGFKKYYNNFIHPKNPQNGQHKAYLSANVGFYFAEMFPNYQEKYGQSASQAQVIEKKIIGSIQNLPSDLKQGYTKSFKKLKQDIIVQNVKLVQQISQNSMNDSNSFDNFLEQSERAFKNGQTTLYNQFIEKLQQGYAEKFRNFQTVNDKINFINEFFIKAIERNRIVLANDPNMKKKMTSKIDLQLKKLFNLCQADLNSLKKMIENETNNAGSSSQINNLSNLISQVFVIFRLFITFNQQKQIEFNSNASIEDIEKRLDEIIDIYSQKLANQPQENISNKDMLDPQKFKKIEKYVEYIKFAGNIIEMIKAELINEFSNGNQSLRKQVIDKYTNLQCYTQRMKLYERQAQNLLQFAEDYHFYDYRKKNFTVKQFESDLVALNQSFQILHKRQQFYLKYIFSQKNSYDYKNLEEKLLNKCILLVNHSKLEIEDTFKDYNSEPASKINTLMIILKALEQKNIKILPKDIIEQHKKELSKLLKDKFKMLRQKSAEKIEISQKKVVQLNLKVKENQVQKKNTIKIVETEIKIKMDQKIEEITTIIDQKIKNETDDEKKKDHEKNKKTEITGFKKDFNDQKEQRIRAIEQKFDLIINTLKESMKESVKEATETLTLYKKAVLDINFDNEFELQKFQKIIQKIPKGGPQFRKIVENCLDNNPQDKKSIGKVLLTTNKVFSSFVTMMIQNLIKGKNIHYVLENLQRITLSGRAKIPERQKKPILQQYQSFKFKYEQYKALYKANPSQSIISTIATTCKDLGEQFKNEFYQSADPAKTGNKVHLLAGIFALWVILKAETYDDDVQYTIQPHPTQITTLILLLGIADQTEQLNNRLAQVGTGEGKSIVLAGLSSYLALVGFKVKCACYSAYLSGRDESNFRQLFQRLGIQNEIRYATFNQLCEDILNSNGTNFKEDVQAIVNSSQNPKQSLFQKFGQNLTPIKQRSTKIRENPTILIVDEVDVFFDDNFFGNLYCPGIKLKDLTVTKFLEYVWQKVSAKGFQINPKQLMQSQQFIALVNCYPNLQKLLKNQVHGMIAGALSYKHDYFLIDKKLVYKDNDTISSKISYGYKTVFANIHEFYKGNVSKSNLDDALQISLIAAEFSYAMLPQYFDNILGVTGTLEVLPRYKKIQLKERYQIEDQYAIPSAFGVNKRRVDNYQIVAGNEYFMAIIQRIKQVKHGRPIIIFFQTARELNEFAQSTQYQSYLNNSSNLTEEHEASVRDSRIIRAVNANNITLMTNSFGRGTDFILLNKDIKENGGLHVIHAFLSHEESQEVQIKGRTARQSNSGSYDCILNENWLEELALTTGDFPNNASSDSIHNIILKAREQKIQKLSKITLNMLEQSDKKHGEVVNIFTKKALNQADIVTYVQMLNLYPLINRVNVKTILGLDATGSMTAALMQACEIIGTAFERAYIVLKEEKVQASIDIKIMIYRNYNSPAEEILESTAYENTPVNLRMFLESVRPKGGWTNEAIEVFFQSINKEDKIDQVILIGDAAPNTPSEVIGKRNHFYSDAYWVSKGYPSTNMEIELKKFVPKKIPVHSFYLNQGQGFKDISQQTGGESKPFNINSPKVADELTAFILVNILKLMEGKSGNSNLVRTYKKMYVT